MSMSVATIFTPLIGQYVWGCQNTVGSCLMMQFGQPRMRVIEDARIHDPRLSLPRRPIHIKGAYSLLVQFCHWRLNVGLPVLDNTVENDQLYIDAFRLLNGQKLVAALAGERPHSAILRFDLGAELQMFPYEDEMNFGDEADQWDVGYPDGSYSSLRQDGQFVYEKPSGR